MNRVSVNICPMKVYVIQNKNRIMMNIDASEHN